MSFSVLEAVESAKQPLTVPALAKIYGVSRGAIYKAIHAGKIPVMDTGLDVVRIDPRSLAAQLRRQNPAMRVAAKAGAL